jgi:hypothetical protein
VSSFGTGVVARSRFEINAPEMRRRRQELHTHAGAAVASVAQVDNPAFLLFLRYRIHQDQHFAIVDFMAKIQEPAMSAHDQGLADFPKLPALVTAPEGLQTHLMKDALAAALRSFSEVYHGAIFSLRISWVNCPFGQVFAARKWVVAVLPGCAACVQAVE